jgi:exosortase
MSTSEIADAATPREASHDRSATSRIAQATVALAAVELVILYAPTVAWMWSRWTENVWEHAHGLLIVPLVGYFISQELKLFRGHPVRANAWGLLLLTLGLGAHVLDTGMHTQLLSAASLILVLPGLSLLLLGTEVTRAIAFPLTLLVLALPIPLAFTEQIHLVLRRFITHVLGVVLPMVGIPTFAEGTTLSLGTGTLEIADACSGFTTLYAAVAVALLTAYTAPTVRRRALVLASAVPLAICANLLRIFLLAVLVVWRGSDILDTFIHPLSGMMTFALALPVIFWLGGGNAAPQVTKSPA